ncbi:MAG: hypothetical protein LUI07_01795 [Lachnospiraceae bacterium]|nr:hypothetical protein [Lachnospiraceae bacterium]
MSKVWFTTGAARGIGKSITDAPLKNRNFVIATTKKVNESGKEADKYVYRFGTMGIKRV